MTAHTVVCLITGPYKGKTSEFQEMKLGTPQGSRLSPLAFVCFMADLDLHVTENCHISQFADDTQSLCVADDVETVLENTMTETKNVTDYFNMNDLVNNDDKAALLYNSKGKGTIIKVEGIGGEDLESKESEKLLGLHINHDLDWKTHIEKLSSKLKKRTGMLCRIKRRAPREKVLK